jgi:Mg2+/Co2+ transporter CorB
VVGARAEMAAALAAMPGREVTAASGTTRGVLRSREDTTAGQFPQLEHFYVVAPAVVETNSRPGFDDAWRAAMWVTRPAIGRLNHLANWCLRKVGVQPADQVTTGQDPDALRHLVEHSATVGTLDERYHGHLTSALELQALTVGDMVHPNAQPSSVAPDADCAMVYEALGIMREKRSHLCTVTDSGKVIVLITLDDVLERLLQSNDPAA